MKGRIIGTEPTIATAVTVIAASFDRCKGECGNALLVLTW